MKNSEFFINLETQYSTKNYHPLPLVISRAEGVWVEDPEKNQYMDMLSAYSAVNQGHCHPKIIDALTEQAKKVTITSRAFYHEKLGEFFALLARITKKEAIFPMNSGAEAVETAIKLARRWGYEKKGIPKNEAVILVAKGNFHGRTTAITGFSSEEAYKKGFGPFAPGFCLIDYGDQASLLEEVNAIGADKIAAILLEPIQGEAGIIIPPAGYLTSVSELCKEHNILFMADEIQTGLGRTGKWFACDWENVIPDVYILGKALGGGVLPVSAVVANKDVLDVFTLGSHGSTFGGNPLAAAVAIAALQVVEEEYLIDNSHHLGNYFLKELQKIKNPLIKEIRGRGLFIGIELTENARPYCEKLKEAGLLCKETHETIIRLAPPLVISKSEIDWALKKIRTVL